MEGKKIKNIITAIGNPILNNELNKIENLNVINNDILYQEGIIEFLEINRQIDFLILNQLLPGNYNLDELIEKIKEKNRKIKIIIILENFNENLKNVLSQKGVYRVFYNNVEIKDIIKLIKEDEKMEKYNEEIRKEIDELKEYILNNNQKNNNKINNKINNKNNRKIINNKINNKIKDKNKIKNKIEKYFISFGNKNKYFKKIKKYFINKNKILDDLNIENNVITILGNNGSGKSIFSILLANYYKKYLNKILIIDFDILNNSLHTMLGVKKYSEKIKKFLNEKNYINSEINIDNLIIKINKKIDLISGINLIFDQDKKISEKKVKEIIEKLIKKYDKIIIDTSSECFFEYTKELIKTSNKSIFITEANLSEVAKSKRYLDMYYNNWKIEKNKIKIIFNKFNNKSININILKKIYCDYKILGCIKVDNMYNSLINFNMKNIFNYYKKFKILEKI